MAYRLKKIVYQDNTRYILLQNENGPCLLLASANALLLRGVIHLPSSCIRSNVVTIEELVTLLADRALKKSEHNHQIIDAKNSNVNDNSIENEKEREQIMLRKKQHQFQIHELMQILPLLQHGMDINPRFTSGPEGYEYTKNLTAFDCLGVNLVHGWLIDTRESIFENENMNINIHAKTVEIIGSKTYNELAEFVVKGKYMAEEAKKIKKIIEEKKTEFEEESKVGIENNERVDSNEDLDGCVDDNWVAVSQNEGEDQKMGVSCKSKTKSSIDHEFPIEHNYEEMEEKLADLEEKVTHANLVGLFLEQTGHQLTSYGLERLHEHVDEGHLCVFFRNNHFSTMAKFEGQLFLLVTDLGYANVNDIVWEKLDAIDGNTDYFNAFFFKPERKDDYLLDTDVDNGCTLSRAQISMKQSNMDADYQLAIQLSKQSNSSSNKVGSTDEDVHMLEAFNLSLQEFQHNGSIVESDISPQYAGVLDNQNSNTVDRDREIALSMQKKFQEEEASEQLARQLQAQETRGRNQQINRRSRAQTNNNQSESRCIIS